MKNSEMRATYLMRHGEDESLLLNNGSHPSPDSKLSVSGLDKLTQIIPSLKNLGIDFILSSTLTRAKQTSEFISTNLDIPIIDSEALLEWRCPSSVYGVSSAHYTTEYQTWKQNRHIKPTSKFEDGESMTEILSRIKDGHAIIQKFSNEGKTPLIVSHLVYLRGLYDFSQKFIFNNGQHLFAPNHRTDFKYLEVKQICI